MIERDKFTGPFSGALTLAPQLHGLQHRDWSFFTVYLSGLNVLGAAINTLIQSLQHLLDLLLRQDDDILVENIMAQDLAYTICSNHKCSNWNWSNKIQTGFRCRKCVAPHGRHRRAARQIICAPNATGFDHTTSQQTLLETPPQF